MDGTFAALPAKTDDCEQDGLTIDPCAARKGAQQQYRHLPAVH